MGYVESILQPEETVLQATRLHWWYVWRHSIKLAVLAVLVFVAGATIQSDANSQRLIDAGAAALVIMAVVIALPAMIERATTELAVTNRRIIHKRGFIQRHTLELARTQVESVRVDQGILGRMLNFGTIVVKGTGETFEPFQFIADPLRFRSAITAG